MGQFSYPELGLVEAAMKVPFGGAFTVLGFGACMAFALVGLGVSLLLALYRRLFGSQGG